MSASGKGPAVKLPPPSFFVLGLLAAWLLESRVHRLWPELPASTQAGFTALGLFLGGFGLTTIVIAMMTFRKARTAIYPNRDASRLVKTGPYRKTRNPMYTGMIMLYFAGTFAFQLAWAIILLPVVLHLVYRFVIAREERYLTAEFGDEYRAYMKETRRWL